MQDHRTNPWLKIPYSDYENHMARVGQSQILNQLTKANLEKYQPKSFALLGCSTGNGLEHVNSNITKTVYAIDINPVYLQQVKKRFSGKIGKLSTLQIDIQKEEFPFTNIDLFFVGLVLEYIEPESVLNKIIRTLSEEGILQIVIQRSKKTDFVTRTKYIALEKLSAISKEIEEYWLNEFLQQMRINLVERKEMVLNQNKSLISLTYKYKL